MLWEFFFKYLHYKEKTSEKLLQQVAIKKLNLHHNYGTILTNIKMYIDVHIFIVGWASTKPRVQLIIIPNNEYGKYYPGAAARPEYGSISILLLLPEDNIICKFCFSVN